MELENAIVEVSLEEIIPNRFQPRLSFDEKALTELSESIKQHGIIQPLVLRKLGDKYEIIAGERRYKAAGMAGLTKVPAVIANIDDNASAEVALVENLQRKNLTAIEEAKSYKGLLDKGYLTQDQLAKRIGVSQSSISNKLRLLNLDDAVQDALLGEQISERHARALLTLENKEDQKDWLDRILRERMTVRQLDLELKRLKQEEGEGSSDVPLVTLTPDVDEIKANAADLNPEPEPKILENFFPVDAETIEIEPEQPVIQTTPIDDGGSRKFFNFLEDEQANLDTSDPFTNIPEPSITSVTSTAIDQPAVEIINDTVQPIMDVTYDQPITPINNPVVEEQPTPIDLMQPTEPMINIMPEQPMVSEQPEVPNTIEIMPTMPVEEAVAIPLDNIATPVNVEPEPMIAPFVETPDVLEIIEPTEPTIVEPTPEPMINVMPEQPMDTITTASTPNVIIYDDAPLIDQNYVDPVNMIDRLDPNFDLKQKEALGTDLKTGINTLRETTKTLEDRGFKISMDEIDFDDSYQIIINIEK